jgi:phage terminase Nu1 subunit (DNA packaging protein)
MLLSGWKDIARYLGSGVRSAQRWEDKGLPIVRPLQGRRSRVFAETAQVDTWIKHLDRNGNSAPTVSEIERTKRLVADLTKERADMKSRVLELGRQLHTLRTRAQSKVTRA